MIKILFVCHGNICRSPMAEFIMNALVQKQGLESFFEIASAATSSEEIGNGIYPPVKQILLECGIHAEQKRATRISEKDFDYYDYIIVMDYNNLRNLKRQFPSVFYSENPSERRKQKISLLLDWTDTPGEIADPWYTGEFLTTKNDILKGTKALLDTLKNKFQLSSDQK